MHDEEELEGTFYEQELQKVNKSDSDFYRVEEILRSRMRNKRKEYYVKCYPDKFNSWVPAESVTFFIK
jgi:O-glycosyl hydrolase